MNLEYTDNRLTSSSSSSYDHRDNDEDYDDNAENMHQQQQQSPHHHHHHRLFDANGQSNNEALMDTPLLQSEDEFDIRAHLRPPLPATCPIAPQGFHPSAADNAADPNSSRSRNSTAKRQLIIAITLCLVFMVAEIVGGYMAGSLAIMADAAHLLTDCISFIVSLVAIWMSSRPPDSRMTFGYKRAEVIGAIISILGIWLMTAFLCYFSISRLIANDFDIEAHTMMLISGIGIGINVIMAFILHGSCSMPHTHSHGGHGHSHGGHGHGHSHSHASPPSPIKQYARLKTCSESSVTGAADHHHHHHQHHPDPDMVVVPIAGASSTPLAPPSAATYLINGGHHAQHSRHAALGRSDSVCSYRSPTHSRTNSFSGGHRPSAAATAAQLPLSSVQHAMLQMRLDDAMGFGGGGGGGSLSAARDAAVSSASVAAAAANGGVADCKGRVKAGRRSSDDCSEMSADAMAAHRDNINMRAAVIHVIGDFIQSVGVFIAAVVINYYPTAKIVDPLCTVLFSVIVMFTTVRIMRDSLSVILDAVPPGIDVRRLTGELLAVPGVRAVHDLCVWSVTVDWPVMAVHLVIEPGNSEEKILASATQVAREDFGIRHCTIQLERGVTGEHRSHPLPALLSNPAHHHQHHHHHHHHNGDQLVDHNPGDAMIHFV